MKTDMKVKLELEENLLNVYFSTIHNGIIATAYPVDMIFKNGKKEEPTFSLTFSAYGEGFLNSLTKEIKKIKKEILRRKKEDEKNNPKE